MKIKNKRINIPLFWKFAISSTIIVVLFGSINVYLLWTSVYKSFEMEIDKRCKVLAKIISEKALTPLVYEDDLHLFSILNDIKNSDSSIVYIFILNPLNEVVAQTSNIKIPEKLIEVNNIKSGNYHIKVIQTSHFQYPIIRDIAYPVLDGEIGTVRLGVTEEHIRQELMEATRNLANMILAFFLFGLAGAFLFSYIITSPIKKISQKAQMLNLNSIDTENSNITRKLQIKFFNLQINDELDVLVTKFSEMINRLKKNYIELKETQRALIQAEKLASLGTLSAGVAHEINNPISGIKNCINRILKKPENTEQNMKYLILIKEAAEKIENVIQHLLSFSRKQDLKIQKVELNMVIDSAVLLTKYKLESNNIHLKTNFNKTHFFVKGSPNHLEQIFVNFIINGIDAINERKKHEPQLKGEINININKIISKTYIHIMDNGIGISKDIKDKIFDPFFTTKDAGKGTGLGLSMSFNLIKEHNGKVFFSSILQKQTEFVIELPCYENEDNI
jgi:two-component system NtrC family sensor kinase